MPFTMYSLHYCIVALQSVSALCAMKACVDKLLLLSHNDRILYSLFDLCISTVVHVASSVHVRTFYCQVHDKCGSGVVLLKETWLPVCQQ